MCILIVDHQFNRVHPWCFWECQECLVEQRLETVNLVEFWGLPPLIPLLQCVNRLGFEICSVNSCQSEQGSWLW